MLCLLNLFVPTSLVLLLLLLLSSSLPTLVHAAGLVAPGGGGNSFCFHAYSYNDDSCTVAALDSKPIPAVAGAAFEGQLVHLINQNSGACGQGLMVENTAGNAVPGEEYTVAFTTPGLGGCLEQQGVNKYCSGGCPAPLGVQSCYGAAPLEQWYRCDDLSPLADGTPQAAYSYGFPCLYGDYNTELTYINQLGQCFTASCVGDASTSVETVVGATCNDLKGPITTCWNRSCPSRQGRELLSVQDESANNRSSSDERTTVAATKQSAAASPMQPHDEIYQEYANTCGSVQYDVYLYVDYHFYALAIPSRQNHHDNNDCPAILTQAEYYLDHQTNSSTSHYTKVLTMTSSNPNDANYHAAADASADKLYIGTYLLQDLRRAFESVDPTTGSSYDIIRNNCADFMLSLAAALNIRVATVRITSYVTRRLVQTAVDVHAGSDIGSSSLGSSSGMVQMIRNSVHFSSLFSSTTHNNNNNNQRRLRRSSSSTTTTTTREEPSDEQVIEALVHARAHNLL